MLDHFKRFAAYNCWANQRLFDAAAQLTAEQYKKDCGVAFQSMQGTLNHILIGDTVWMSRFEDVDHDIKGLDQMLHEDHADLTTARRQMDQRIISYVATLDQTLLDSDFTYSPITLPDPVTMQLNVALSHLFNHQTHHRGQAHGVLTNITGEAPPLDLIYFQIDSQTSKAG